MHNYAAVNMGIKSNRTALMQILQTNLPKNIHKYISYKLEQSLRHIIGVTSLFSMSSLIRNNIAVVQLRVAVSSDFRRVILQPDSPLHSHPYHINVGNDIMMI